ncbi:L-type lectin-domain containing receptor kinase VII.1-like [Zingiber officinale]|uniref:Protein kinase domain-containing protein n=1 Tax=Zingiber officinale TaxID=94328 RepID=A0A8J5F450_ZINOF|nr:L-type lectin-domain containing receptor kinase VII.1-like [Zingiber officinale]KAG6481088.1 hypothetical protein ZIOFF_057680 [Zingiber officinale]
MSKIKSSTPPPLLLVLLLLNFHFLHTPAIELLFNGFKSNDLILYGNASLEPHPSSSDLASNSSGRRYLSLTTYSNYSVGRALLPFPVRTKDANSSAVLPFSTSFLFSIAPVPSVFPGHGLAFLLAPAAGTFGAVASQHLGLFNLTSNGDAAARVVAVEFDVFKNEEFRDINSNHVGVDLNSLTSVSAAAAGYWPDENGASFVDLTLNDGTIYQAWVDYVSGRLNVTMAPAALCRKPLRPLISVQMDLSNVFLDEMYVGFCASTGMLVERHRILAWSFSNSNFSAGDGLITTDLPNFLEQANAKSRKGLIVGFIMAAIVLLFSSVVAVGLWRKWTHRKRKHKRVIEEEESEDKIEEWELEYWPHRIGYQEIYAATEGFSESNLIGRGGHGVVYKGILGGTEVAVKLFSQTNSEEAKYFAAEVSSLGRLKHRNLVGLRGWCRSRRGRGATMILVYDYMENGSLDRWIFGGGEQLNWVSRVSILRDVAEALLYLHEGWGESVVIHRDVKASNVMLDAGMIGRLGDFGLARAHQRGCELGTTRVVGSAGYLAPEVVRTGRATAATDVYAFGVMVLEVVTGRPAAAEGLLPLVFWARNAAARGAAPVDARARASEGYDEREAALLVAVALACTRDDAVERPTTRQLVRMLEACGQGDGGSTSARLLAVENFGEAWAAFPVTPRQPTPELRHLTFLELQQSLSSSSSSAVNAPGSLVDDL